MKESNEFMRKLQKLIEEEYGESGTSDEEFATEMTVINLDDLSEEDVTKLAEMGIITWVSAESEISAESTVEGEEAPTEGNTSDALTEMLKSEPREDGGYTVSFATEKGAHATVTHKDELIRSIYAVGETVVTVNPYTHEFVHEDLDGTPLYFTISSIAFDSGDETFRYLIEGEDEWVSEEWLDKPMVALMSKIFVEITMDDDGEVSAVVKPSKKTGLQINVDEFTSELTVNTYLDMMLSEDVDKRAYGKEMLTQLSAKASTIGEAQ